MKPRVFLPLLFLFCCTPILVAGEKERAESPLGKNLTNDRFSVFLINSLLNYYGNNGIGSYNPFSANSGLEYPIGSGKEVTFEDGLIWGGFHKGRSIPNVGGSTYRSGLQAGKILIAGTLTTVPVADDPSLPKYRVFRVRPDIRPTSAFDQQLEALLQREEVALIGRYQSLTARSIYDQYVKDWNEWPAGDGAPYDDRDGNNTYDPAVDIPGVPGADQTLWYVANDMDSIRVSDHTGSPPIGLEMQKTIWGYRQPGALGNTIFICTKLINRSGAPVDSMYIGQWADGEVGDPDDDVVGCDTLLNLGFTYNGGSSDYVYGTSVPAMGFVLLSGPVIPGNGSDSAIVDLCFRKGLRSLPLGSFTMINHTSVEPYADPVLGPGGDAQFYCLLRARSPRACTFFIDPTTGQPSAFFGSGDPLSGRGWVDGEPYRRPADRRMLMSVGPFTFAEGDTQEIVMANLVAQGGDRLSSVLLLQDGAQQVLNAYRGLLRPWPSLDVSVRYVTASCAELSLRLDARRANPKSAAASVMRGDGSVLQELALFDDGAHRDSVAGDGVFGGTVQIPAEHGAVTIDVRTAGGNGTVMAYRNLARGVTIAGEVVLDDPLIFSENVYSDGKANPGENIRFGICLTNQSVFTLPGLRVFLPNTGGGNAMALPTLSAGATWQSEYNAEHPESYASLDVPTVLSRTIYPISCLIIDDSGNRWNDTLWFPASPSRYIPVQAYATHVAGRAEGNFAVRVIDRREVRDHQYLMRVFSPDSAGKPVTFTLQDSTEGRVVLERHELPDSLGHNIPLTDGFRLMKGIIYLYRGMYYYGTPVSPRLWTWLGSDSLALEGFDGAMGNALEHWPSGGVPFERLRNVLFRFAATDTGGRILNLSSPNASFAYRYLQNADRPAANPAFSPFITNPTAGYAYQDYSTMVPFAAFDQDTVPPRRLMVGYLENNVPAGSVNGRYWPPLEISSPYVSNTSADGAREWFFVFDVPYSTAPDPRMQVDISSQWTPMMWFGTPGRRGNQTVATEGAEFLIVAWHVPVTGDIWSFNPVTILGGLDETIPAVFQVFPNYPNPLNFRTTIKYALPFDARVIVRIYTILGQQVRLLADGNQLEGYRTLVWDGKNDQGVSVGSGVYLYRLEMLNTGERPLTLTHVGKMVLVR
jgi:hypothetical protein